MASAEHLVLAFRDAHDDETSKVALKAIEVYIVQAGPGALSSLVVAGLPAAAMNSCSSHAAVALGLAKILSNNRGKDGLNDLVTDELLLSVIAALGTFPAAASELIDAIVASGVKNAESRLIKYGCAAALAVHDPLVGYLTLCRLLSRSVQDACTVATIPGFVHAVARAMRSPSSQKVREDFPNQNLTEP